MSAEEFRTRLVTELATDEPPPPLGTLVSAATMDGVRLRRRTRIVQMAAGTAGVTAVAFAATAVAGGIGSGTATSSAASGGKVPAAPTTSAPVTPTSTTPATTTPAKPTSGPGSDTQGQALPRNWQTAPSWMTVPAPTAKPTDGEPVTGQSAAKLLEDLITSNAGPGTFSHVYAAVLSHSPAPSSGMTPGYVADLYWNHGTVAVRYLPKPDSQMGCAPSENANGNVCYDYKLADGTEVNYFHLVGQSGATEVKAQKGQANLSIKRPDGTQIVVLEINGPETGSTGADRPDMPLTEQQLYAIASDPHWAPTMDASFVAAAHSIQLAAEPY